jgi:hypothetical protein
VISLDPIHHTVSVGEQQLELQPLTYALFSRLHEDANEIVSIATLTDEVWANVTVSPDTLKQRIFLLRKSLDDAGIKECTVQSVRGQGYRLVLAAKRPTSIVKRFRISWFGALGILIGVLLFASVLRDSDRTADLPDNNRVVFWMQSEADWLTDGLDGRDQEWVNKLSSNSAMTFIAADRNTEQTISEQARVTRAALVSQWSVFEADFEPWVRFQILEPKTAAVLRVDLADMEDDAQIAVILDEQFRAVERILAADILPLTRESLIDTGHPAWSELRELAQGPGEGH